MTDSVDFGVCLFCGSREGDTEVFRTAARQFGAGVAERRWSLIYGGSSTGLMAAAADAALLAGGRVVGVMPEELIDREIAHPGLDELKVVQSMSERKTTMAMLSDAFTVLPGGIGTMDELFEIWTWRYLGRHEKPSIVINIDGFYDALKSQLAGMCERGFLSSSAARAVTFVSDVPAALARLEAEQMKQRTTSNAPGAC